MKNLSIFAFVFALFALSIALPDIALAQSADSGGVGQSLLDDIEGLIGGRLGTVIGLGVSLFGLWVWLAQQSSWGLVILIAGAAVTAFPGLFGNLQAAFQDAFSNSGAGNDVRSRE